MGAGRCGADLAPVSPSAHRHGKLQRNSKYHFPKSQYNVNGKMYGFIVADSAIVLTRDRVRPPLILPSLSSSLTLPASFPSSLIFPSSSRTCPPRSSISWFRQWQSGTCREMHQTPPRCLAYSTSHRTQKYMYMLCIYMMHSGTYHLFRTP